VPGSARPAVPGMLPVRGSLPPSAPLPVRTISEARGPSPPPAPRLVLRSRPGANALRTSGLRAVRSLCYGTSALCCWLDNSGSAPSMHNSSASAPVLAPPRCQRGLASPPNLRDKLSQRSATHHPKLANQVHVSAPRCSVMVAGDSHSWCAGVAPSWRSDAGHHSMLEQLRAAQVTVATPSG
jgi:hypothetical protein